MTDTPETGGPAFPFDDFHNGYAGMSLRDWFAGQALAGIVQYQSESEGDFLHASGPKGAAKWAYAFADAMLAARGAA